MPAVAMSSFLLVGCNMNNDNIPNNNETPMEEVREGVDRVVPDPGVNTESPVNNNGMNDNGLNDNNGLNNNNGLNGNNGLNNNNGLNDNTVPNAENKWIKEPNVNNDEIINNNEKVK